MNRRDFLNYTSIASGAVLTSNLVYACQSNGKQQNNFSENSAFDADLEIRLNAVSKSVSVLPGNSTQVWTYQAEVLKGDQQQVQTLDESYLGPIIKVRKGQKIRVRLQNSIGQESITHWHGLHIPPKMDGHPMYAINKGKEFVYEFEVNNRGGSYWFHPHPDKITGPQVYRGLAGLFWVYDDDDDRLNLPSDHEIPLVIQDRSFDSDNQLVYLDGPSSQMHGFLGEELLVNGKPDQTIEVKNSGYRLRVLNGSNSRIYKLGWDNGDTVTVMGTDGGLLERPVEKNYLMMAPGERYDLWLDFNDKSLGEEIMLRSLTFNPGMMMQDMGAHEMGMASQQAHNGESFDIVRFKVNEDSSQKVNLPAKLSSISRHDPEQAVNRNDPRRFRFFMQHMQWTINGETFEMKEVADFEKVRLDTMEQWEFENSAAQMGMMGRSDEGVMGNHGMMHRDNGQSSAMGGMMQMPHPVHIHGLQFQIIDRSLTDVDPEVWETVKEGFVDEGWQDTFLLLPGMKVNVLLKFEDYTGMYIYHCHNLEHEDMGMMRNYLVEKS